jgi:acyl carrier protein
MMTDTTISKEEIAVVFPKVAEIMADALGSDAKQIEPQSSLIEGLGAESIDFLDIIFRLERAFKLKSPRGKIVEDARGDLTEAEFEKDGVVTPAGVQRLKAYLSEVPADRFPSPLNTADIPRLFTVETLCKMVIRQQRAAVASGVSQPA